MSASARSSRSGPAGQAPNPPQRPIGGIREDSVQLTIHHINNLPRSMQQLDPSRITFELVVNATVKFYLEKNGQMQPGSIARMEMPPLSIPFSPSTIFYKRERDRFFLDFANLRAVPNEYAQFNPSSGAIPNQPANQSYWRYPAPPPNIIVLYEIFVGVKEHRIGSSTSSWVYSGAAPSGTSASDPQGFRFLVPAEAVMSGKLATRQVGLSIGQVALTLTVPTPDGPFYNLAAATQRIEKLLVDKKGNAADLKRFISAVSAADGNFDEIQAYTNIRNETDPTFYRRRLELMLDLYCHGDPNNPTKIEQYLQRYQGREEIMMRDVVFEYGPELSSILARHRITAFIKKYRLEEKDVAFAFPNNQVSNTMLEKHTEQIFEVLRQRFGNEPRPTSYLFTSVSYEPDRRTYLMEHLTFPVNKNQKNWRDVALAARQKRPAFTNSPLEREVNRVSRSGRQLPEIEILQEKHEPEFRQIIPSIADALSAVIEQHSHLQRREERFSQFETSNVPGINLEDYIQRICAYTYISPSSLLAAIIFLDRLCERYPQLTLTDRNIYKLLFVSVRVSSKVVELRSLNNKNFSPIGGVSNKHLNELEDMFLKYIKFDLFLAPAEFNEYSRRMNPPIAHNTVPRHLSSQEEENKEK